MKTAKTFGAELEKPVSNTKILLPHGVTQAFFKQLSQQAEKRHAKPHYHKSDLEPDTIVGVLSDDLGEQGLDHGFNILETASAVHTSLENLNTALWEDLRTTQQALAKEDASVVNFSNHPLAKADLETYTRFAAPKGLYPFLWFRGWNFTASINANAQNSPATGIEVDNAADAVSAIMGSGAAMIALFGNSPFVTGRISRYKESRVTMWDTVMKHSRVEGDRLTAQFPPKRFQSLAEYFSWMFGGKTGMHFVLDSHSGSNDYKSIGDRILFSPYNPSVLEFLAKESWDMFYFSDLQKQFPFKRVAKVKPTIAHLEMLQWTHFAGARVRFGLQNHTDFPLQEFLQACKQPDKQNVEAIFKNFTKYMYIEGRDPGANFPDEQLWHAGDDIARSVLIAPSAIQKGLLANLKETIAYIDSISWETLGQLRDAAITDGLEGNAGTISVRTFTEKLLELAQKGLPSEEKKYLSYPQWVLSTNQNGADRALAFVRNYKGSEQEAIQALLKKRAVLVK